MKKKIGYLLLIVISVIGSRLIFGKDYHLNSDNLKEENLYVYNIFDSNRIVSTYVDEEEYYYNTSIQKLTGRDREDVFAAVCQDSRQA